MIHNLTLADVLAEHARSRPQVTAVVDGDVRLTYPALDERVTALAAALAGRGVAAGERVLWLGQNAHAVLELLLACSRLGAIFCPANWRQSADELRFVLDDLTPRVVVWEHSDTVAALDRGEAHWVLAGDDYEEFLGSARADGSVSPRPSPRSWTPRRCWRSTRRPSTGGPTPRCSAVPRSSRTARRCWSSGRWSPASRS